MAEGAVTHGKEWWEGEEQVKVCKGTRLTRLQPFLRLGCRTEFQTRKYLQCLQNQCLVKSRLVAYSTESGGTY